MANNKLLTTEHISPIISKVNTIVDNKIKTKTVLYSELYLLKNNNLLIPGKWYVITDYQTIAREDALNIGPLSGDLLTETIHFFIAVQALDTNKLCEEGWAIPDRTIQTPLKIWYSLTSDQYDWVMPDSYGAIYRMIDLYGNDCPFDFKNLGFADGNGSYLPVFADTSGADISLTGKARNNVIERSYNGSVLTILVTTFGANEIADNKIGAYSTITARYSAQIIGNTVGTESNVTMSGNCKYNTVGNSSSVSVLRSSYNTIGNKCINVGLWGAWYCQIEDDCYNIQFLPSAILKHATIKKGYRNLKFISSREASAENFTFDNYGQNKTLSDTDYLQINITGNDRNFEFHGHSPITITPYYVEDFLKKIVKHVVFDTNDNYKIYTFN